MAETDAGLRDLMQRTIEAAGFDVLHSANPLQLEVTLRASSFAGAHQALVVAATSLSLPCAHAISTLGRERLRADLPWLRVLLTCEFGAAAAVPPELPYCVAVGLLEKPFDLAILQGMAYRCRTTIEGPNMGVSVPSSRPPTRR